MATTQDHCALRPLALAATAALVLAQAVVFAIWPAAHALYLASDDAAMIHGITLYIDGGISATRLN